ncbi:MAG: hypothetical protein AAF958_18660 [Planctomycetota bacterium]
MQWFYKIGTLLLLILVAFLVGQKVFLRKQKVASAANEKAGEKNTPEASVAINRDVELVAEQRRRQRRQIQGDAPDLGRFETALERTRLAGEDPLSDDESLANGPSSPVSGDAANADAISLRVGVIGATPKRQQVLTIDKLPFSPAEVRSVFREAQRRTCRMVLPDVAVRPPVPRVETGQAITIGRVPALSVGLSLAAGGGSKLTGLIRGQVREYFREHRLSIQPTVHIDNRGRAYFGTDCQAAFYALKRPGFTLQPEPLVKKSVSDFRALGVCGNQQDSALAVQQEPGDGRTLVMAFSFQRETEAATSLGLSARNVMEFLFLHLPASAGVDDLSIEVFATSDSRSTLHRIASQDGDLTSQTPTMTASIKFDSTVLMGMYPSDPVVTELRYRSAGVMAMQTVREMVAGRNGSEPQSLSEVLDSFAELSAR